MNLLKFKYEYSDDPRKPEVWRWVFQVNFDRSNRYASIGFVQQRKYRDSEEWHDSHVNVYEMNVTNRFIIGSEHFYYDGPHCMFSLGWLHFVWFNWDCKKCMPDDL